MGKTGDIYELINLLVKALRHKIGSIVNSDEPYAEKYARDADELIKQAKMISLQTHLNNYDKLIIKTELKRKLRKELEEKEFLDEKKFEIMDEEIKSVLKEIGLD